MAVYLAPLELFYGSLTFIAVVISLILGFFIALKYVKYRKIEFILVGITWIFLVSPYWSDAIQFMYALIFQEYFSSILYFFLANAFIAPIHITWIWALTKFIFRKRKKLLLTIFSLEGLLFEISFLIVFILNPTLIGERKSAFVVEWALWIQIYLLISIVLFLITGFMFARQSLKSQNRELKIKGRFLLIAIICFTFAAIIDVIGADAPNELTIFLARAFLIISVVCFYIGYTMPRFIKDLFIKSEP
jgi:hypothetical protein